MWGMGGGDGEVRAQALAGSVLSHTSVTAEVGTAVENPCSGLLSCGLAPPMQSACIPNAQLCREATAGCCLLEGLRAGPRPVSLGGRESI